MTLDETLTVSGLQPGTKYWFWLQCLDEAGNDSGIISMGSRKTASQGLVIDLSSLGSPTSTLTGVTGGPNVLSNADDLTVKTDLDLATGGEGMLYESGGGGSGMCVYVFDGKIYANAGAGGILGPTSERYELSGIIQPGSHTIVFTANFRTSAELYLNQNLVDSSPGAQDISRLAGVDNAGSGAVYKTVSANYGGWTSAGDGAISNIVINSVEVWPLYYPGPA